MINNEKPQFSSSAIIKNSLQIGAIIRQLRKDAKLTQIEAAGMCEVGTRFLSDLENGKPTLHLGKVLKVLQNFGLLVILKKKKLNNE